MLSSSSSIRWWFHAFTWFLLDRRPRLLTLSSIRWRFHAFSHGCCMIKKPLPCKIQWVVPLSCSSRNSYRILLFLCFIFFFFCFFFGVHRVHPMYLDALLLWRLFIKLYYCVSKRKSFCKNGFFLNLNCWFVHLCHFGLAKIKCSTSFKVGFIFCIECRGYALFSGKWAKETIC